MTTRMRTRMTTRLYPVPIKEPSEIQSWAGWPADVFRTLWKWNHGDERPLHDHRMISRLSFRRSSHVFKCVDCGEFCRPHPHGAAVLDGDWLCDDCVIVRARRG